MAFSKVTPNDMGAYRNIVSKPLTYTACAAQGSAFGAYFDMSERDDKYLVAIKNTGTATANVKIKAGNNKVFGSGNDLSVEVTAGDTVLVKLDSGRFKNTVGNSTLATLAGVDDKVIRNGVVIESDKAAVSIAVVLMPA